MFTKKIMTLACNEKDESKKWKLVATATAAYFVWDSVKPFDLCPLLIKIIFKFYHANKMSC
jgi:uncharacterized membrane protein YkvA (DUF1232 family)